MPEMTSPLPWSPSGPALGQGHACLPGPESGWQEPSGDSVFSKDTCYQRAEGGLFHTGHTRAWLEAHLIPAPSCCPGNRLHEATGPPARVGPGEPGPGPGGKTSAGLGRAGPPGPRASSQRCHTHRGDWGTGGWPMPIRAPPQTGRQVHTQGPGACTRSRHPLRPPVHSLPPQPLGYRF